MKNAKTLLVAIAAAAALAGCAKKQAQRAAAPEDVYVATPIVKPVEVWDEFTAKIGAVESVDVRARVSGYLQKICFTDGQLVKEGDLLFEVDPRPYEAVVAAAKARIAEIQSRLALANSNLERAKGMYKATVVSKEVYETRGAEVLSAKASLEAAKAQLRDAELNLEFTKIRAPFAGRVSERLLDVGNLVNANSTLLTTLVKSDVVQAYFEASEQDIIRYEKLGLFRRIDQIKKTGPVAKLYLLSDPSVVFEGKVTYFDNKMGSGTSSLTMRADIANPDDILKSGMFAKIKMLAATNPAVMLVREDVIGTDLVNRYVMVVDKDNKVVYKPVKLGALLGKFRIVESGLAPTDRVAVKGLHNAVAGRTVNPIAAKMDE